jgi:hypothetical protein
MVIRPDAHQSATSIRTTRSFCPDAHQCLEASNSSRLHPSGRSGKSSWRSSEFEKFQCSSESVWRTWLYRPNAIQCLTSIRVSASRHSYGKTAATVRTMFSIRQDVHTKFNCLDVSFIYGSCVHQFNRPDISLQGPDAPSLIMVIMCSWNATIRTLGQHRPDTTLLWKLSVLLCKGGCSWPSRRLVKPSGHPPVFWS